jgi:hypothetical protein
LEAIPVDPNFEDKNGDLKMPFIGFMKFGIVFFLRVKSCQKDDTEPSSRLKLVKIVAF